MNKMKLLQVGEVEWRSSNDCIGCLNCNNYKTNIFNYNKKLFMILI